MRLSKKGILLGVLFALLLLGGGVVWRVGFHNRGLNRNFDPARLAASETRMWQAYYTRNHTDLAMEMAALLREQMGVSLWTAREIIEPMARGAMIFAGDREGRREAEVLSELETAYARLGEAAGEDWDPRAAARAELAWWVARRTPGQDSPEQVGALIAALYALLYGGGNAEILQAGVLRAQAAALRDAGGPNADWPAVERLLNESYAALRRGVGM